MELKKKEKISSIVDKLIYGLEFIIAILFTVCLYKTIIIKNYMGNYSKLYLGSSIVFAIILLAIILYTFIKHNKQLEKIFLSIAIPIGMAYLIFLIPTYAPDESAHIYRSYEISRGKVIAEVNDENYICSKVPTFFAENDHRNLNNYQTLEEKIREHTNYEETQEVKDPANQYFITLYPNTVVFLLARITGMNGIIAIYMARMVNFVLFLLCGYYAIKLMPFAKIVMMTYLFIPMVLHQAISLSADSITNSVAFLFIAYTLYLRFKETEISKKNKIIYIIMSTLIALHKIAYLPLIFISLLFATGKKMSKKETIKLIGIVALVGILSCGLWMVITSNGQPYPDQYAIENNVNSGEQIKYIITNPIQYIKMLCNTINYNAENYYLWFMGYSMGWMDICVQRIFLDLFFLLMIFSPFVEKNEKELDIKSKWILLLIFISVVALTITAMYIAHTGVQDIVSKGVQGRYFIPVAILVLLCLCGKERYIKIKHVQYLYPILITLLNMVVVKYIIEFFI